MVNESKSKYSPLGSEGALVRSPKLPGSDLAGTAVLPGRPLKDGMMNISDACVSVSCME
jgi:hypothetical protein